MAQQDMGLFVPNTFLFNLQQINDIENIDPTLKKLLVQLYEDLNTMALALNVKTTGLYDTTDEFVTGSVFFPDPANLNNDALRQEYRKVINFGALPDTTTKPVAHGITVNTSFRPTDIYGVAYDTANMIAIPLNYVSNGAGPAGTTGNIEVWMDAMNINVDTTVNATNFDQCIIVIEYLHF